jgi:hypothetical protein
MAGFLLGLDIGSSSVKGKFGLLSIQVKTIVSAQSPEEEMEMIGRSIWLGRARS